MAGKESLTIVLNERPTYKVEVGKTFREEVVQAPTEADLQDGQVLFETLYLSMDPTMRGWLKDVRSYLPPVQIGEVMRGTGVGRILASKNPMYKPGDLATGICGWREIAVMGPKEIFPPQLAPGQQLLPGLEVYDLLGVLSSTGLTAYFGLEKIGQPKPGELVVISGAAGATGSIVGQIAKLKGARVIGTAGSDEKCQWLKNELGFDDALNYKAADFKEKFLEATKDFIDVFWDNVRGEVLDLAFLQAKPHARFVMCGGISQYNAVNESYQNFSKITAMRIRMEGFIVLDYMKEWPAASHQLGQWIAEGKIKPKTTVIEGGLKKAEEALVGLFEGVNSGKLVVEVKKPEA